ncbi:hypothetical protein [Couchioplanes azureus]|uniref:hypothetical protein n=1 Tax=Couchioplanes caeruleus TaxID=56438 RepID=UPI0016710570|nr:hypothetical protein [Couchioplanes caeruleus]
MTGPAGLAILAALLVARPDLRRRATGLGGQAAPCIAVDVIAARQVMRRQRRQLSCQALTHSIRTGHSMTQILMTTTSAPPK